MSINRPNTIWYDQGKLAYKLGKGISECPYREYSYGYSQWMLGYKEASMVYTD